MCEFVSGAKPILAKRPRAGYKVVLRLGGVVGKKPTLAGPYYGAQWGNPSQWMKAICLSGLIRPSHNTPSPLCDCGFHVWKTYTDATAYRRRHFSSRGRVVRVQVKGLLQAHPDGWRAEYLRLAPRKARRKTA